MNIKICKKYIYSKTIKIFIKPIYIDVINKFKWLILDLGFKLLINADYNTKKK